MRDGERTELDFEAEQPFRRRGDRRTDGARALIRLDIGGDAPERAEQEGPGADGRIGERHVRGSEPCRPLEQRSSQGLIDEVHHRADDFRRRVVGARELAQAAVVDFEKMLVEIEPRFRLILAERRPVHFVQDARQRAERCFERLLVGFVFGQNVERRADQRVRFLELDRREFDAVFERYLKGARHQQAEGHRLGVAIGELRVAGVGKQQRAPIFLQMLQAAVARRHLL